MEWSPKYLLQAKELNSFEGGVNIMKTTMMVMSEKMSSLMSLFITVIKWKMFIRPTPCKDLHAYVKGCVY